MGRSAVKRHYQDELKKELRIRRVSSDDLTRENFTDPDVLYALRFAAAAISTGSIYDFPGASHSISVNVVTTDEGHDSRLLAATYGGTSTEAFLTDFKPANSYVGSDD